MAKIRLIDALISGGVGAFDIAAEELAPGVVINPLRGPDIYRILVCGGSLIANLVPAREIRGSETTFYASLPLLEKTIRDLVKGAIAPAAVKRLAVKEIKVTGARVTGTQAKQKEGTLPTVRLAP